MRQKTVNSSGHPASDSALPQAGPSTSQHYLISLKSGCFSEQRRNKIRPVPWTWYKHCVIAPATVKISHPEKRTSLIHTVACIGEYRLLSAGPSGPDGVLTTCPLWRKIYLDTLQTHRIMAAQLFQLSHKKSIWRNILNLCSDTFISSFIRIDEHIADKVGKYENL